MFPFKFHGLYFCSHREDSTKGVGFNIGSFSSSSPPDKDIQIHFCCSALLWGLGWFSCMLMGCSMLCCSTSSCVSMHSLFPTSKRWNTSWNTGFGTWAASCANCFTSFTRKKCRGRNSILSFAIWEVMPKEVFGGEQCIRISKAPKEEGFEEVVWWGACRGFQVSRVLQADCTVGRKKPSVNPKPVIQSAG